MVLLFIHYSCNITSFIHVEPDQISSRYFNLYCVVVIWEAIVAVKPETKQRPMLSGYILCWLFGCFKFCSLVSFGRFLLARETKMKPNDNPRPKTGLCGYNTPVLLIRKFWFRTYIKSISFLKKQVPLKMLLCYYVPSWLTLYVPGKNWSTSNQNISGLFLHVPSSIKD